MWPRIFSLGCNNLIIRFSLPISLLAHHWTSMHSVRCPRPRLPVPQPHPHSWRFFTFSLAAITHLNLKYILGGAVSCCCGRCDVDSTCTSTLRSGVWQPMYSPLCPLDGCGDEGEKCRFCPLILLRTGCLLLNHRQCHLPKLPRHLPIQPREDRDNKS